MSNRPPSWFSSKEHHLLHNPHGHTTTYISPDGTRVIKQNHDLLDDPFHLETITRAWTRASEIGITPRLIRIIKSKKHGALFEYEFQPGADMYTWWRDVGCKDARRTSCVRSRIVSALKRLHKEGIVFVDVNAGNIIVDNSDRVWLIDWDTVVITSDDLKGVDLMFDMLSANITC